MLPPVFPRRGRLVGGLLGLALGEAAAGAAPDRWGPVTDAALALLQSWSRWRRVRSEDLPPLDRAGGVGRALAAGWITAGDPDQLLALAPALHPTDPDAALALAAAAREALLDPAGGIFDITDAIARGPIAAARAGAIAGARAGLRGLPPSTRGLNDGAGRSYEALTGAATRAWKRVVRSC